MARVKRTNFQMPSSQSDIRKERRHELTVKFKFDVDTNRVNDPSAGSPTETLLRLLLPLSDKVH